MVIMSTVECTVITARQTNDDVDDRHGDLLQSLDGNALFSRRARAGRFLNHLL
jgi:hypothetical protein